MDTPIFGRKIDKYDYRERNAVYGLLFNDKNQIGIIKTPRGYFLPGGGIEENESSEQCLIREFLEETGFGIKVDRYIGSAVLYDYAPSDQRYLKMIGHFYLVTLTKVKSQKLEEDHQFVWLDRIEAIDKLLLPHQSWAIKKALDLT